MRRLCGLVGVGFGISGKSWRILGESAAKCGVGCGGGGLLWWPLVVGNGTILVENWSKMKVFEQKGEILSILEGSRG